MLLSHVTIENFRGIGRLSLDLDRTTVVIGENNHGKTSLVDVLERCLGAPDDGGGPGWEYRDFRRGPDGIVGPIRVVLAFGAEGIEGEQLRAEFTGTAGSGAMTTRFLDAEGQPLDLPEPGETLRRLRRMHPVLVVRLAQPVGSAAIPDGEVLSQRTGSPRPADPQPGLARGHPVADVHLRAP